MDARGWDRAWNDGYAAFEAGKTEDDNFYELEMADAWFDGFYTAEQDYAKKEKE